MWVGGVRGAQASLRRVHSRTLVGDPGELPQPTPTSLTPTQPQPQPRPQPHPTPPAMRPPHPAPHSPRPSLQRAWGGVRPPLIDYGGDGEGGAVG